MILTTYFELKKESKSLYLVILTFHPLFMYHYGKFIIHSLKKNNKNKGTRFSRLEIKYCQLNLILTFSTSTS